MPRPLASTAATPALRRLACALRDWVHRCADPYRPELHYMRGPGPKWRLKHPGARLG